MAHLPLNPQQIDRIRQLAAEIADEIQRYITAHSTTSVERTILRLYGVDGVDETDTPLANRVLERFQETADITAGISRPFAAAMIHSGRAAQETAEMICRNQLTFMQTEKMDPAAILEKENRLAEQAVSLLDTACQNKREKQKKWPLPPQPWRYLIVATGNVYEDRLQAVSAVKAGADIVAQIRSTAQSLLDYIPYGSTTEGFGGTYATQANFRIMREALDEASEAEGRYIRLVNYSSGLCMAEIAACAAMENLDILLNDSMYGILFRDINMKRTFVDQYFSRLICARAGMIINTGEDNYLTTADAVDQAHTVTASQMINQAMARKANLPDDLLGLGHAFEISPDVENAFLYELAHAQLARQLFPHSPIKYMPPTKHKSTDIFASHAQDTLFNLASVATCQGIHLAGILTEAIHTPFMHDRAISLDSVNYVFKVARNLSDEIQFKKNGLIQKRAQQVLDETERFLLAIKKKGLMNAVAEGKFAGISRSPEGGKGLNGVFRKGLAYSNPILKRLEKNGENHG